MKKTSSRGQPASDIPKGFIDQLGAMHTAEKALTLALPLMEAAAESKDLKALLKIHLGQTRGHVKALDKISEHLDVELPTKDCPPIRKLIGQGVKVIGKRIVSSPQDDGLIRVGRQIEQYEIRSYEKLCSVAASKGMTHEVALLTSVLHQEQLADELLGDLAAGKSNIAKLVERASLERAGVPKRSQRAKPARTRNDRVL